MDLSDPTRAVTPTLDGPVLAVLASAGRPLTISDVAAQSARGSEIGIRRSVGRLVEQGIVRGTVMGRNTVYELNREHVAAGIADQLAGLRLELWARMRSELEEWALPPIYAGVFGSAARGDGDAASDIDVLLVHLPLLGETITPRESKDGALIQLMDALTVATSFKPTRLGDSNRWHEQVDGLRDRVQRWTGNQLQVVDLSLLEWWKPASAVAPLLREVNRDAIELVRVPALPPQRFPAVARD